MTSLADQRDAEVPGVVRLISRTYEPWAHCSRRVLGSADISKTTDFAPSTSPARATEYPISRLFAARAGDVSTKCQRDLAKGCIPHLGAALGKSKNPFVHRPQNGMHPSHVSGIFRTRHCVAETTARPLAVAPCRGPYVAAAVRRSSWRPYRESGTQPRKNPAPTKTQTMPAHPH